MQDIRRMQVGQLVDFCIEYNNRHTEKPEPKYRKASQEEINAFFG